MKEILITSSVLIAVIMLLRRLFRKRVSQRLIYAAWLLVALRLLIPFQFGRSQFSIVTAVEKAEANSAPIQQVQQALDKPVAGPSREELYDRLLNEYLQENQAPETPDAPQVPETPEMPQPPVTVTPEVEQSIQTQVEKQISSPSVLDILATLWILGICSMGIWFITANLLFMARARRGSIPFEDQKYRIRVSSNISTPCIVGLFRPVIYLTPECAEQEDTRTHVLTHEKAHLRHGDHIWALVRCLCLCIYWFNPLVWVAAAQSRRDCELACDESALKELGDAQRIAYGKTLLDIVSQSVSPSHLIHTATAMNESKKQLAERVNFIVKKPRNLLIAGISLLLTAAIVTGCAFAGGSDKNATDSQNPPSGTEPSANSWEISDELKSQIKQEYLGTIADHSCTAADVKMIVVSQVDAGIALFISCNCGSIDLNASWEELRFEYVADMDFYIPSSWWLSFYQDGSFNTLSGAYNLGHLTYPELRTIWDDYHSQFPAALEYWKQRNPGLSAPPLRDSSGLDYHVNEDGKTCTITGTGVCNELNVVIPETIDGYQVTAIGEMAFWPKKIISIIMPDSITSIGYAAFKQCHALRSVVLSNNLTSIGKQAFMDCTSLTSINLPDSLTYLGGAAFSECIALTSINIPAGITSIEGWTFDGCKKLSQVSLPAGLTGIGEVAFQGCRSLTTVSLPQSLSSIGRSAFQASGLTNLIIPEGVTTIEDSAFAYCHSLTEVTIPGSVKSIGQMAFRSCSSLQHIHISANLTQIGQEAFAECGNLTSITVEDGNSRYAGTGNCLIDLQESTIILGGKDSKISSDGSIKIIGELAFFNRTEQTQIVIPNGTQRILRQAFLNCSNLTDIYIPVSVTAIDCVFEGCPSEITIHYAGTVAQWCTISLATPLGDSLQTINVICADGELSI